MAPPAAVADLAPTGKLRAIINYGNPNLARKDATTGTPYGISVDPVAAAKVLHAYAKENDKLVIKAGAMPGQVMSAKEVGALATLPGREELLAMLMGPMQAPVAKFVQTLNEVPGKFVRTLAAVRDQKEKQAA